MPISHIDLFIVIVLINHIALLRITAANELNNKALICVPLCSGLLTSITLVLSITALELINLYAPLLPLLQMLDHFIYLLVIGFVAHLLCVVCYQLKPFRIILALFPLMIMNSIGLGWLVPTLHIGLATTIATLILAIAFMITSSVFYYANLCLNNVAPSKKLSITLFMAGMFAFLFSKLIAFY